MNQEAFVVLGCNLIYKNKFIVKVKLDVWWSLSGREKVKFSEKSMYIVDFQ